MFSVSIVSSFLLLINISLCGGKIHLLKDIRDDFTYFAV